MDNELLMRIATLIIGLVVVLTNHHLIALGIRHGADLLRHIIDAWQRRP